MSKVKKQHFVPQFYLSRWAIKAGTRQVYVFNKELEKSYISNIQDIASANYFYDFPKMTDEQKNDFIQRLKKHKKIPPAQIEEIIAFTEEQVLEKAFGELESINSKIIQNIITRLENFKSLPLKYFVKKPVLNADEILELSYYIATQHTRTEEMRIIIEQLTQKMAKHLSDMNFAHIDDLAKDTQLIKEMGKENFQALYESVKSGKFTKDSYTISINKDYIKLDHIKLVFELADQIANILMHYKWIVLINNTDIPFVTSDSPVVKKANLKHPFYSYGFASKGIEIFFPLSPKYAINIIEPSFFREKLPLLLEITLLCCTEENIIHYNDLITQEATSQVYSNQNDFSWIRKRIKDTPNIAKKHRKRIA